MQVDDLVVGAERKAQAVVAQECAKDADDVKWYVIRSGVLNDRFVLCMRKNLYKEVTACFPDTVIYFLPEMEELLALRDEMEQEAWCRMVCKVHLTKKTFRGWVVPDKTKGGVKRAANPRSN